MSESGGSQARPAREPPARPAPAGAGAPAAGFDVDELARAAGLTTRNVRALQARGVLRTPRRAGGRARYTARDLDELLATRRLQRRGWSVAAVADALAAQRAGRSLADLLGLEAARTTTAQGTGGVEPPAGDPLAGLVPWPAPTGRHPPLALLPDPIRAAVAR